MYNLNEHKFVYASWAASRAAMTSPVLRFKVEDGQRILKSIKDLKLPQTQKEFDLFHRENRLLIISEAKKLGLTFTHGIAAKIMNVYYKSIYVCDLSTNEVLRGIIHPPIDSLLLLSLYKKDSGGIGERFKESNNQRWSKFNSDQYEYVIENVKFIMDGRPLWMVEEFWVGHQ